MKKILLLGAGELGKEFTIAAKRLGQYVIACDNYNDAPAMQVADCKEVFNMLDGNALNAIVQKHKPDVIVPEIEAIRTEQLYDYEAQGIQVVPSAKAVNYTMNRKAIRNLAHNELGLRTALFYYATTPSQLHKAAQSIGFPCVVKPLMSSSGHGQTIVKAEEQLDKAFTNAMEGSRGDLKEIIVEEFITFESEFTLLTITQKNGCTLFCPPIGHIQKGGDFQESWQPFQLPNSALQQAQDMAKKITTALTGEGLWGVEFFLTKDKEVIFSELSPRPHDTGMVTLARTTNFNEFDLHLRALLHLPIASIQLEHCGCTAVISAKEESNTPPTYNMLDTLKEPNTNIRIFGKPTQYVGRRMGIVLCYGDVNANIEQLRSKAKRLASTVLK